MKINTKDSKHIYWEIDGKKKGSAFLTTDGIFALEKCPICESENYCMNVMSGNCTWCSFSTMNNVVKSVDETNSITKR